MNEINLTKDLENDVVVVEEELKNEQIEESQHENLSQIKEEAAEGEDKPELSQYEQLNQISSNTIIQLIQELNGRIMDMDLNTIQDIHTQLLIFVEQALNEIFGVYD